MQPFEAGNRRHQATSVAIEIERPEEGQTIYVRSLSGTFGGLFIHYQIKAKRSDYCHPTECYPGCKRQRREWKGYVSCEIWREKGELWIPCVFEVTAYLHCELAAIWDRGQVWGMTRPMGSPGKNFPTVPQLVRVDDPGSYPPAFDVMATLKRVLGPHVLHLDHKNPMPARPFAEPSKGEPPIPKPEKATPEQMAEMREKLKARGFLKNGTVK